jgi:DNA polymerase-3 subunit beta
MKLSIEKNTFLKALNHVQSVVERRTTIPILSHILLEAKNQQLQLTATDLDLMVSENVQATVKTPGSITTPAHILHDIVRKLPDNTPLQLEWNAGNNTLHLQAGRSKFALPTLPREDFPITATGDMPSVFQVPAGQFKKLLQQTSFAMSNEETRYYLNGIFFHIGDSQLYSPKSLKAVATDGHRLARSEMIMPAKSEKMPSVVVPRKTVQELMKLLEQEDGVVTIGLSPQRMTVTFKEISLSSKLIDGNFPDYERVIPTNNQNFLEVDRLVFTAAVDRVATICSDKLRSIKLQIQKNNLIFSAANSELGSAVEEIEVAYEGTPIDIGFNAKYLADIMQQLGGKKAKIALSDASSPVLISTPEDGAAVYVLMPMRI